MRFHPSSASSLRPSGNERLVGLAIAELELRRIERTSLLRIDSVQRPIENAELCTNATWIAVDSKEQLSTGEETRWVRSLFAVTPWLPTPSFLRPFAASHAFQIPLRHLHLPFSRLHDTHSPRNISNFLSISDEDNGCCGCLSSVCCLPLDSSWFGFFS